MIANVENILIGVVVEFENSNDMVPVTVFNKVVGMVLVPVLFW